VVWRADDEGIDVAAQAIAEGALAEVWSDGDGTSSTSTTAMRPARRLA
jgi:hypothetical protein